MGPLKTAQVTKRVPKNTFWQLSVMLLVRYIM